MPISLTAQPTGIQFSRNPISYRIACTNFASQANYRVEVKVTVGSLTAAPIAAYPSPQGFIDLDVSDIAEALLAAQLVEQIPVLSGNSAYIVDRVRSLRISLEEKYGAPPVVVTSVLSNIANVMDGGVDAYQFPGGPYWLRNSGEENYAHFLPDRQRVGRDQPAFLNYLNWGDPTSARLEVQHYNAAGVMSTSSPNTTASINTGRIGVFQVGPAQLGLPLTALRYRVRLRLEEGTIGGGTNMGFTQFRDFTIDALPQRSSYDLLALNVWGCPEVVRCVGRREKKYTFDTSTSSRVLPQGYLKSARQLRQYEHGMDVEYQYNTGFVTERMLEGIAGLLSLGQVWALEPGGLKALVPQGLRSIEGLNSDAPFYDAELKFSRAIAPRNFTPEPEDTATDNTPYWLEPDGDVWERPASFGNWENP